MGCLVSRIVLTSQQSATTVDYMLTCAYADMRNTPMSSSHSLQVRRIAADKALYNEVTIKDLTRLLALQTGVPPEPAHGEAGADKTAGLTMDLNVVGNSEKVDKAAVVLKEEEEEEEKEEDETCEKCWVYDIHESNPKGVCPPGCHNPEHACCAEGTLQFLKMQGKLYYVPGKDGSLPPATYFCTYCRILDHEQKLREGVRTSTAEHLMC